MVDYSRGINQLFDIGPAVAYIGLPEEEAYP